MKCDYIQFDEPVWTENVDEADWGAESLITSLINFQMLNLIYTYAEETLIEKEVF